MEQRCPFYHRYVYTVTPKSYASCSLLRRHTLPTTLDISKVSHIDNRPRLF